MFTSTALRESSTFSSPTRLAKIFSRHFRGLFGGIPDQWNESTRAKLALIFPAAELLCGIGLLLPRTRIRAAALLIVMHTTLILVLGPMGA